MAQQWTYSGDPSKTDRDHVRFMIGDTDSTDKLLYDKEIEFLISQAGNVYSAAVEGCKRIAALYAKYANESVGQVSISHDQKSQHYYKLAETLKRDYVNTLAIPYAGGISTSDKETYEEDDDRVKPAFTRKLMEEDDSDAEDYDQNY